MGEQPSLWEITPDPSELLPFDGSAVLHQVLDPSAAARYFELLRSSIRWEQHEVRVFGRTVPQPRLTAWFGDAGEIYEYSGLKLKPTPWSPELDGLRSVVESVAGARFNSALANLYRDGSDGVAWHSDDEPSLGPEPVIGSVSLGASRRFDLRHRATGETVSVTPPPGSVLVMSGQSQAKWKHQVPKTARTIGERLNITFRRILQ